MKMCCFRRTALFFLFLSSFYFSQSISLAQVDRGGLVGTVTDSSGAVVPGVVVTMTNVAANQSTKVTTDVYGNYAGNLLHIGVYTISAEKEGFKRTVQPNVEVGVNQTVRVDLVLQVGEVTQAV